MSSEQETCDFVFPRDCERAREATTKLFDCDRIPVPDSQQCVWRVDPEKTDYKSVDELNRQLHDDGVTIIDGANLAGLDLKKLADLSNVSARAVNLADADLHHVNLSGLDFANADLRGCDLRNAEISNTELQYSELEDANLRSSKIAGSNLFEANLKTAS